ncbi:MAG: SUMF1/EgtB/PvdO family nonheme iron enzyme [Anaerolineales bacterium]|nr:SUMF1/EgtB/PvdO family nonheme iron enzyme [Anaerolineales bacterium]
MTTPDRAQLRQFLQKYYNDDELENLVFDYFPEVAELFTIGMTKPQKVRELIGYAERHGVWVNLLTAVGSGGKAVVYQQLFAAAPEPTAAPVPTVQPRNPRQIFISHARADAAEAQALADELAVDGWRVWLAPDSILPGERWVAAIERGLQESGVFLLLLSPQAVASRWVRFEADIAIELERNGEVEFVPLLWRPCSLPLTWRAYQWVDWRGEVGEKYGRLRQRLGSTPATTPRSSGFQSSHSARLIIPPSPPPKATEIPKNENYVDSKTGLEMIYIPPGPFLYGANKEKRELPGYWISKTPVTNAVYKRFLDANPQYRIPKRNESWAQPYNWDKKKRTFPVAKADHPVVLVSWNDAAAFAKWAGMVLPTEEQWEKAARETDGREYPWGAWREGCANTKEAGVGGTTAVGRYSPQGDSPYGCVDMSGNVWEWMATEHEAGGRVLRGGSWSRSHDGALVSNRSRNDVDVSYYNLGFRLVAPIVSGS